MFELFIFIGLVVIAFDLKYNFIKSSWDKDENDES
jgi:hypothetical protein